MNLDKKQSDLQDFIRSKMTDSCEVLVSPRTGKSKIGIDLIKESGPLNVLWVTSSAALVSKALPEEFNKWGCASLLSTTKFVTYRSLGKEKGVVDLLILDEHQHVTPASTAHIHKVPQGGTYSLDELKRRAGDRFLVAHKIVAMSGTETYDSVKRKIIKRLGLPLVYRWTIKDAIQAGILPNYTLEVVPLKMLKDEYFYNTKWGRKKSTDPKKYNRCQGIYNNAITHTGKQQAAIARQTMIHTSYTKFVGVYQLLQQLKDKRCLVFCHNIDFCESLRIPTYHSKNKKDTNQAHFDQFNRGEIKHLALVNSGGTGFDFHNVEALILTNANSDINGGSVQKIARCLLKSPDIRPTIYIMKLLDTGGFDTQDKVWIEKVIEHLKK